MRPKATAARMNNLVILTTPNREKLLQPRKLNLGPFPPATQRTLLAMLIAKEAEGATSQAPTPSQPMNTPVVQFLTSLVPLKHTKYFAMCTSLGKICPNKSLCPWTGMKISKEKRGKIRRKEKIKIIVKGRHPKPTPDSHWLLPSLLSPPDPP